MSEAQQQTKFYTTKEMIRKLKDLIRRYRRATREKRSRNSFINEGLDLVLDKYSDLK